MEGIFERGDKVNFKGNDKFKPVKGTYVWAVGAHMMISYYIEHPDGNITKQSMANNYPFEDGFEQPHSNYFKDGLKYIWVMPDELEKAT